MWEFVKRACRGSRPRASVKALCLPLLCVAFMVAAAPAAAAPAQVPCAKHSDGRYHCGFWPAGDGVHGGAVVVNDLGYWVGYLNQGDNWVSCQMWGGKVTHGSYYNHWWAWTEANDRKWGWVNAVWAKGGANDGKFARVPECDPIRDAAPLGQKSSGPPKPTPKPKPPACPRYEIFGLRGSGEAYAGPYKMGSTVGLAAEYAVSDLPAHSAVAYSIPYPAASVGTLLKDPNRFFQSMDYGEFMLEAAVHRLAASCRHTGIAIIGYSQGAGVASQAMRMMASYDRARVTALVLFADTYSKGDTKYAYTFNPFTQNQRGWKRHGHGIFGGKSIPLPASRVADVCFNVDPVCVSGGNQTIANAFFASVHSEYKSWDGNGIAPGLLPLVFGHFASHKLKGR
jgi:Cutinase